MTTPAVAVPARLLPHRTPAQLLVLARSGLADAMQTRSDEHRYGAAHLAALRAAAAVLASRAEPVRTPGKVTGVWTLLPVVAPEFEEWATYFASHVERRAAVEAGIPRVVTAADADALLRQAEQFVAAVEITLGLGAGEASAVSREQDTTTN